MDYTPLAVQLMEGMKAFGRAHPLKHLNDSMKGEAFLLHYVADNNGKALPGEISHAMDVSSARVAAALNSLEGKGLITREIDANNRRQIIVRLTQEGLDLAEEHENQILGMAVKMLSLLGEHDAREFVRILGKLAENAPSCFPPE